MRRRFAQSRRAALAPLALLAACQLRGRMPRPAKAEKPERGCSGAILRRR